MLLLVLGMLCWEFFKTGLFAVGGGLATLPFLYDMANRFTWFTAADIANMIAISESTPGPIGINMATYAGFNTGLSAGGPLGAVLGAIVAPIAEVLPSLVIIMIIAKVLEKFKKNQIVQDVFYGLRPASVGLIAAAGVGVVKISLLALDKWVGAFSWQNLLAVVNWPCVALAAVLVVLTRVALKKAHPVVFIGGSAVVGVIFGLLGWI
ncbi:MAG: chromate transporter [Christensenellaceae bacterium]|nr:chromate transporter [Christensenellaceae bacterium]